jgi:formylglycine-generating enzyme required for sulfatase activity
MPSKVFISYRRDDSRYQARMIHEAFCQVLPQEHVFMDTASIPPGANFRKILKDWVNECEVLLALIGPGWIDATDLKTSRRRLDNPNDFVRIEIGEALARDIPVVPVLIDGTPMPDIHLLPDDLKELVDRQAEFVEYRTFDADVERLIKKLRLTQQPTQSVPAHSVAPPRVASGEDRMRAEGRIKVDANFIYGAPEGWFKPGAGKTEWFKDHEHGPELVVVPAYKFSMGSTDYDREKPVHKVAIPNPFAVGRFSVTFSEWDACVADGGCDGYRPDDQRWGRDRRPVIHVSWDDAKRYINWLNGKTGKTYRLLSEAEREYVTRAGTTTPFWWGSSITTKQANYNGSIEWNGGGRQFRSTVSRQTPGASSTCTATSSSGARMSGTTITTARPRTAPHGWKAGMIIGVSSAAVPGTSFRGSSARPTATGAPPTSGSTTSASGWPER